MRLFISVFLCISYISLAQNTQVKASDSISFNYTILAPEVGESDVSVRGDTVSFTIFYVDADCGDGYEYRFEKRPRELVILRALLPEGRCSREDESLYGVKGALSGVPKGVYRFTLLTQTAVGTDAVFSEPIQVK